MDLKPRGLKALVNGATRGLGRAIAETLAAEGCDVAIRARGPHQVEEAAAAIGRCGTQAEPRAAA